MVGAGEGPLRYTTAPRHEAPTGARRGRLFRVTSVVVVRLSYELSPSVASVLGFFHEFKLD